MEPFLRFFPLAKKIFEVPTKKTKKDDQSNESSDDEMVKSVPNKRKRLRIINSDSDSDSDRENESDNNQKMEVDIVKKPTKSTSTDSNSKKKIKIDSKMSFEEKLKASIDESRKLCDIEEKSQDNDIIDVPTVYKHNTYSFLKKDKIMDAKKRRPSDPNYDPTTLYVPEDHLNSLTPVSLIIYFKIVIWPAFSIELLNFIYTFSFTGDASMVDHQITKL